MPATDNITLEKKYRKLQDIIYSLGSVAVAFSGGVDSTFLLKAAQETLGDKAMALSLIHISEPTRPVITSRMPSSA